MLAYVSLKLTKSPLIFSIGVLQPENETTTDSFSEVLLSRSFAKV